MLIFFGVGNGIFLASPSYFFPKRKTLQKEAMSFLFCDVFNYPLLDTAENHPLCSRRNYLNGNLPKF